MVPTALGTVDWGNAVAHLLRAGWVRLPRAIGASERAAFIEATPGTWFRQEEEIFGVRQGGLICGCIASEAPRIVQDLATGLTRSIAGAATGVPPLPPFTDVTWTRDDEGSLFITPHADPPTATGVIAVVTLYGAALFRVWDQEGCHEWETEDGDVVLLRGHGWPADDAECPVHEAEPPGAGGRMILTLRHNTEGPGGDYFAHLRRG